MAAASTASGPLTVTNSTIAYNTRRQRRPRRRAGCSERHSHPGQHDRRSEHQRQAPRPTTSSPAPARSSASSAYNLIGTGGSGGLINGVNGNQVGVANPGLDALADNGGPTQTIALLPGSPAIDTGSNALAVDPAPATPDHRSARHRLPADRQQHRRHRRHRIPMQPRRTTWW